MNSIPDKRLGGYVILFIFMNQYTALGQAGVVGHLVQQHVEVEQSLDQEHVHVRNLLMEGITVRATRQRNLCVTQMGVQV